MAHYLIKNHEDFSSPPRPPTLVDIQREHIQRVYLPWPQCGTNNAPPLPLPILILSTPSNFQREQTNRNNNILLQRSAFYSTSSIHQMHWRCKGHVYVVSQPLHPSPCGSRRLGQCLLGSMRRCGQGTWRSMA